MGGGGWWNVGKIGVGWWMNMGEIEGRGGGVERYLNVHLCGYRGIYINVRTYVPLRRKWMRASARWRRGSMPKKLAASMI